MAYRSSQLEVHNLSLRALLQPNQDHLLLLLCPTHQSVNLLLANREIPILKLRLSFRVFPPKILWLLVVYLVLSLHPMRLVLCLP